jgi:hypothetical protein
MCITPSVDELIEEACAGVVPVVSTAGGTTSLLSLSLLFVRIAVREFVIQIPVV